MDWNAELRIPEVPGSGPKRNFNGAVSSSSPTTQSRTQTQTYVSTYVQLRTLHYARLVNDAELTVPRFGTLKFKAFLWGGICAITPHTPG